jgi:hypothetical protein
VDWLRDALSDAPAVAAGATVKASERRPNLR